MSRNTNPTTQTRLTVLMRDEGCCVVCGRSTLGYQIHHRRPRGMGGSRDPQTNSPANLVTVCPEDHTWIESAREESLEAGFLVPQGRDPAKWTIDHAVHGLCYLLDSGSWVPFEDAAS